MSASRHIAAGLLIVALFSSSVIARADIVERVVAVVNDQALFLSDLRKRAVPFLPKIAESTNETERAAQLKLLYDELLSFLIDEELMRQLANAASIRVTNEDVERAIENIRLQNNLTEADFWTAVKSQGLSETQYRRDLKKQLVRFKVINERVRSRVNITEEEVRRKYEERARSKGSELRFHVRHVVVAVEEDASTTTVADARARAEGLYEDLTADNFAERADELGGGDLGWVSQGDLATTLESAILQTPTGGVSQPVRGESGFHIFFVEERMVGSDFPSFDEMKQELYQEMLDQAMVRQEKLFIEELRRKAVINRML